MTVFLALLIAHLLADFLFQRRQVIEGKRHGRWHAWFEHGAIHLVCLVGAWLLFSSLPLLDGRVAIAFAVIVATHLAADWIKVRRGAGRPLTAFILDQAFHVLVLLGVALWFADAPGALETMANHWADVQVQAGLVLAAYLVAVFGCGWLNRHLLDSLYPDSVDDDDGAQGAGLARAGLRIGWRE